MGDPNWVRYGRASERPRVSSRHRSCSEAVRVHEGYADRRLRFVFGARSVRALGETDLNPVSGLGKISQLFFAWIQPGNIVANIIAGGVAEAGAQQYVFTL